jgi:hypothetical protein
MGARGESQAAAQRSKRASVALGQALQVGNEAGM